MTKLLLKEDEEMETFFFQVKPRRLSTPSSEAVRLMPTILLPMKYRAKYWEKEMLVAMWIKTSRFAA